MALTERNLRYGYRTKRILNDGFFFSAVSILVCVNNRVNSSQKRE